MTATTTSREPPSSSACSERRCNASCKSEAGARRIDRLRRLRRCPRPAHARTFGRDADARTRSIAWLRLAYGVLSLPTERSIVEEQNVMAVTRAQLDEVISKLATKADLGIVVDAL